MREQILDGLHWCYNNLPKFDSPKEMWDWFKLRTKFKSDPKGTELLQTLPSMMNGDYWGETGLGDCDCFSIALATAMSCEGWENYITIVSRTKKAPIHIFNEVEWEGERFVMDLTNPYFNMERNNYRYYQTIPVNL
jgi:hypothetical protein